MRGEGDGGGAVKRLALDSPVILVDRVAQDGVSYDGGQNSYGYLFELTSSSQGWVLNDLHDFFRETLIKLFLFHSEFG